MSSTKKLPQLFRSLLKELRHIELKQQETKKLAWKHSPVYRFVKKKVNLLPGSSKSELLFLHQYILLLNANRISQEISVLYKGVGERTIEEAANLVGLKLPKLYVDPS